MGTTKNDAGELRGVEAEGKTKKPKLRVSEDPEGARTRIKGQANMYTA
jgi:hypothetical protein